MIFCNMENNVLHTELLKSHNYIIDIFFGIVISITLLFCSYLMSVAISYE